MYYSGSYIYTTINLDCNYSSFQAKVGDIIHSSSSSDVYLVKVSQQFSSACLIGRLDEPTSFFNFVSNNFETRTYIPFSWPMLFVVKINIIFCFYSEDTNLGIDLKNEKLNLESNDGCSWYHEFKTENDAFSLIISFFR